LNGLKEVRDILAAWRRLDQPEKAVLATLVKVQGSAYRKPGARFLITEKGTVGAVSGGCLEQDLVQKARTLGSTARVAVFDMTAEDDELWGYAEGCNGVLHILLERLRTTESHQLELVEDVIHRRSPGVIATVIQVQGDLKSAVGSRVLVFPGGKVQETILNPFFVSPIVEHAAATLNASSHIRRFQFTEGMLEVFFEVVHPPISLTILGAGDDAIPMYRIARELGWDITVIDHRPAFAAEQRFPEARVVLIEPEKIPDHLNADHRSAVVIMTHSLRHDQSYLPAVLAQPFAYIGLLGSRERFKALLGRLEAAGAPVRDADRARIHTPAGLDIGSEAPGEIALAIVAEIQTVIQHRNGGFLRNADGPRVTPRRLTHDP
jgi:xanthine/CO dehydrogenase XdhC/CoxF family maturation factor